MRISIKGRLRVAWACLLGKPLVFGVHMAMRGTGFRGELGKFPGIHECYFQYLKDGEAAPAGSVEVLPSNILFSLHLGGVQ